MGGSTKFVLAFLNQDRDISEIQRTLLTASKGCYKFKVRKILWKRSFCLGKRYTKILILQGYQRQTLVKYFFTLIGVYLSFPSYTQIDAEAGHQLGPPSTGRSVPLEPLEWITCFWWQTSLADLWLGMFVCFFNFGYFYWKKFLVVFCV